MHQEAIILKARPLLSALTKFKYIGDFRLVGGTALAFQIGHRISVDLDWFSAKTLPKNLLPKLQDFFHGNTIAVDVLKAEELTARINGVQVTFFHYPFPWLDKPVHGGGFNLASIKQIAVMKAQTINRRAAFKDYVDLYFIVRDGHAGLAEILSQAKKLFKEEFSQRLFLEQLVYSEDLEEKGVEFLGKKVGKREIQKFFEKEIKSLKV
jgi:hypothetical protein